ncbi:MAG: class I SAM-dependent rRNA methyltransferase [Deltaproteobacteria bacterium]|nr:class I SAM-dependent rRNA methyltransferase [Deltaproteobacteria bacterium]
MRAPVIRLSRKAVSAVERGHPWVFQEPGTRAEVGAVVELHGERGRVGWGLADEGSIAVRVLGRGEPEALSRLLIRRIAAADQARVQLLGANTDAYRVVNASGDGLPGMVIDRYGPLAVLRLYARAWEPHLAELVAAISSLGWVEMVFRRFGVERVDGGKSGGEALFGPVPPETSVVVENGVRFLVRPHVGQKTGLFLDQREHRALVGRWAAGREVANLFGYTGGFSIYAALGGASRVITVDIAADAVEDARENFRLNGVNPDAHGFEVADAFEWVPRGKLGFLIVDPPSLAHDKSSESAARRAYEKLHRRLGPLVARGGLIGSSSCTSRLGVDLWRRAVGDGLQGTGDWAWHWVSVEPPDHPTALVHEQGRYLKFGLLRRI